MKKSTNSKQKSVAAASVFGYGSGVLVDTNGIASNVNGFIEQTKIRKPAPAFKGMVSKRVKRGLKLVADGESIRSAAVIAGCSFGGLAKAIARKRKEALK